MSPAAVCVCSQCCGFSEVNKGLEQRRDRRKRNTSTPEAITADSLHHLACLTSTLTNRSAPVDTSLNVAGIYISYCEIFLQALDMSHCLQDKTARTTHLLRLLPIDKPIYSKLYWFQSLGGGIFNLHFLFNGTFSCDISSRAKNDEFGIQTILKTDKCEWKECNEVTLKMASVNHLIFMWFCTFHKENCKVTLQSNISNEWLGEKKHLSKMGELTTKFNIAAWVTSNLVIHFTWTFQVTT